jgi:hypothetical protein
MTIFEKILSMIKDKAIFTFNETNYSITFPRKDIVDLKYIKKHIPDKKILRRVTFLACNYARSYRN